MGFLKAAVFFLIAFVVLALGHYYLWRRTVKDTGLKGRVRRAATWGIILALVFLVPIWILSRVLPRDLLAWPSLMAFMWKGLVYYGLLILAIFELPRIMVRVFGRGRTTPGPIEQPEGEGEIVSRRAFLARTAAGSAVVGSASIGLVGVRSALGELETPEIPVALERLPRELSGTRIAVISDVHLGPVLGREFVEQVVARTNALKPDLVALTGDLVDGSVGLLEHDIAPFGGFASRYGTYFVTGNHEYYSGVTEWMEHMKKLGIHVLDNRRVTIGDRGASFDLAGVHDFRGAGPGDNLEPDLQKAVRNRDPERELVLLAHQPAHVEEASMSDVGLQISGHTHGGQIWPWGLMTLLTQPYIHGLHRHGEQTQIYVTRGTGFWGPPMRILAPAEISLLILVPA